LITGKGGTLIFDTASSDIIDTYSYFDNETQGDAFIRIDNKHNGWVFNKSGNIWRYKKESARFEKFRLIPEPILSYIDHERYYVYVDSRDITWISTYGNGLFAIEEDGNISHFTAENSDLRTNFLLFIEEDKAGNMWIGTENAGISKINYKEYFNKVIIPEPLRAETLKSNVRSLFEDKYGNIWVGTKNGDIYIYDKEWNSEIVFSGEQKGVYTINADKQGNIWAGTKGDGLRIFPDNRKKNSESHSYLLSDAINAGENNIYAILCDTKGRIWIGTFGNGLILCEWKNGRMYSKRFSKISMTEQQIRCLQQDSSGKIWAGGENGLVIFDPDSLLSDENAFDWYYFDKNNPLSLNNNIIKAIYEDSRNRIWLGTSGGGLNLAIKNDASGRYMFKHYTSENGLSDNIIQSILEDDSHNLWISTENGLSRFNTVENYFENFIFSDSWNSDYYFESAGLKKINGDLLFGNYNGVYLIDPFLFEKKRNTMPAILTGLSINGISVKPNTPDSPLIESIIKTNRIKLKHNQNSFALEFSSLDYQNNLSNRYTYILENYDKEWNPVTQYNIASYKNIPPGKYMFKVKSINTPYANDSMETLMEVIIVPPFWKSIQAIVIYVILLIVIAYFTLVTIRKMNRLNNAVVIEKELTEYRLHFFTNISHEFRTPLTLIRGSIESMYDLKLSPFLSKQLATLDKSSSRLMRLIDQLLEFRKIENNQLDLQLEYAESVSFIYGIFTMFNETSQRNQIDYTFIKNEESHILLLDRGKIEKIVYNLLSNAFKNTPRNGIIQMELLFEEEKESFKMKVSDSGIGIPPDKEDLLFKRFKQINPSSAGIGIGLNLTSELVEVHKGSITYNKSEWGGACFTVTIPMNQEVYNSTDIIESVTESVTEPVIEDKSKISDNEQLIDIFEDDNTEKDVIKKNYKILLIEDDEEVCIFIEDKLKKYFTVTVAHDGLTGWNSAIDEQPNLIVCDVMMPKMDGFEVTRKIRSDFQTSHIPIILLTAHSSIDHQLEGINSGADAYITKPFSTRYLITRIVKLIEQREKLYHKFAHEPGMVQPIISTTDKDAAFIEKIHLIIDQYLGDAEFTVDDFSREANMGRTIFFKKVKGITNYSPNEYLRIIRLKKATELLKATDMNVSEIAYDVGFNDPDYFSKCFKEQFGITPRQFRNKEKINLEDNVNST
jgi:signal transduction histidine kinase/DNA-binding response OmpR family regulator/streptogramin lyase